MSRKIKKKIAPEVMPVQAKISQSTRPNYIFFMVAILLGLLVIGAVVAVNHFRITSPKSSGADTDELINKVSLLIDLPNESPTIATVSDKNELKDQPFFAKAENGDKVLIYAQARKAYLYRPSSNKMIEVAPINIAQPFQSPSASSAAQISKTPVRVAIYNGSDIDGYATQFESQLAEILPQVEVTKKDNAKSRYRQSIVVDISGNNKEVVSEVIGKLKGVSSPLPSDEIKPDADVLIILGSE